MSDPIRKTDDEVGSAVGDPSVERRGTSARKSERDSSEIHTLVAPRSTLRPRRHDARRARWRAVTRGVKPAVFALSLLPLAWIAWAVVTDPDALGANPINEVEHFTGEWALRFLMFTLAVTPARMITGWGGLVKYRRMLGLFAFFYATVHLATWVGLDMELVPGDMWHDIVKHKYITIGVAGWLMMLPLAVTSTRGWIRRLGGRRWQRLHTLTYAAAVAGLVHFFWAVKKDLEDPIIFAALFGVLFAYRGWVTVRRNSGSRQT